MRGETCMWENNRMRKQILATVVLALGAAGCVPGNLGPIGPQYATGQQIFNTLTNFSVVGSTSSGASYCEYHAPNGQLLGRGSQGAYQGSWQVNGNQICYNSPQSGQFNNCQNVQFNGTRATFYSPNGQSVASGNLIGGNTC